MLQAPRRGALGGCFVAVILPHQLTGHPTLNGLVGAFHNEVSYPKTSAKWLNIRIARTRKALPHLALEPVFTSNKDSRFKPHSSMAKHCSNWAGDTSFAEGKFQVCSKYICGELFPTGKKQPVSNCLFTYYQVRTGCHRRIRQRLWSLASKRCQPGWSV